MNTYTVILVYQNGTREDRLRDVMDISVVTDVNSIYAAHQAKSEFQALYGGIPPNVEVLAVFEGKHRDVYGRDS